MRSRVTPPAAAPLRGQRIQGILRWGLFAAGAGSTRGEVFVGNLDFRLTERDVRTVVEQVRTPGRRRCESGNGIFSEKPYTSVADSVHLAGLLSGRVIAVRQDRFSHPSPTHASSATAQYSPREKGAKRRWPGGGVQPRLRDCAIRGQALRDACSIEPRRVVPSSTVGAVRCRSL